MMWFEGRRLGRNSTLGFEKSKGGNLAENGRTESAFLGAHASPPRSVYLPLERELDDRLIGRDAGALGCPARHVGSRNATMLVRVLLRR